MSLSQVNSNYVYYSEEPSLLLLEKYFTDHRLMVMTRVTCEMGDMC